MRHFPVKEKRQFYSHSFPIHRLSGYQDSFPPGQYSFPFSFVLDHDLPGTFQHIWREHNLKCFAKIRYKLTAGFRDLRRSNLFFESREVIVNQRHRGSRIDLSPPIFDREVRNCFCCSHGHFQMAAIFGKNEVFVGDMVHCSVSVDATKAKTNIKNVKCELLMRTTVKAQTKQVVKEQVVQQLFLGPVRKGTCRTGPDSFAIDLKVHAPGDAKVSSSGKLVKNAFEIRVTAQIDGAVCCDREPSSRVALNIYNRGEVGADQMNTFSSSVKNWHPQTFDPYICQFTNQFEMPKNFENNLILKNPSEADLPYQEY